MINAYVDMGVAEIIVACVFWELKSKHQAIKNVSPLNYMCYNFQVTLTP